MTRRQVPFAVLIIAGLIFTAAQWGVYRFAVDDYGCVRSAALPSPLPRPVPSNGLVSLSGRTLAPERLTLLLNGIPVDEQAEPTPAPASSPTPPPRSICTTAQEPVAKVPPSFTLTVPPRLPAAVSAKAEFIIVAQLADHPEWGSLAHRLGPGINVSRAAPRSADTVGASRTTHIWIYPYSLKYSSVIGLPADSPLLRARLIGLSDRDFLQKALDVTVDGSYRLSALSPHITVFKSGRRALVVVNGDSSAFTFTQGDDLKIRGTQSPWLDYPSVVRRTTTVRGHKQVFNATATPQNNDTLEVTVSGFTVSDYAIREDGSNQTIDRIPGSVWRNTTVTWYGTFGSGYDYDVALKRDSPKSLTDIRAIVKQVPPPVWSPLNIPIGILQIAILMALILGLYWVVRSGNEPPITASLVGILTADTCISLFVRINLWIGWKLFPPLAADKLSGTFPATHWLGYGLIVAGIIAALLLAGALLFRWLKMEAALASYAFTILAACSVVVVAMIVSINNQPPSGGSLFAPPVLYYNDNAHQVTDLLWLRGVCSVLAFALLLIQFRPDVFVTALQTRLAARLVVLMGLLALLAVCAWFVSPSLPPNNLNPFGLYVPSFVVSDVALFAKNLAPLLFAITLFLPGLYCGSAHAWKGREWHLAFFITVMCVGYSYIFLGIPVGLVFALIAIRFIAIRAERIEEVDRGVAGRDAHEISPDDIVALQDIRRANLARASAKDAFLSGQISKAEYDQKDRDFESYARDFRDNLGAKADYEGLVLGYEFGPAQSMLENGRVGAMLGLVVGLVTALLHMQGFLATFSDSHLVVLDSLAVFALAILHPVPAGFALGYTLAYLRGNMAATKGIVLALALCVALIPYDFLAYSAHDALSESLRQLLLFGLIGLAMDALTAIKLARILPLRELLSITGFVNVTATAAVAASIVVTLIAEGTRQLLDVAMQNATAALHVALSNLPTQL